MRLSELVISAALFFLLSNCVLSGIRTNFELSKKVIEAEKKADCVYFVSESFRNTCRGNGFDSLLEWQKSCQMMFGLDYIGYGKADAFLAEETGGENESDSVLYYGSWIGKYGEGEVYERGK